MSKEYDQMLLDLGIEPPQKDDNEASDYASEGGN